MNIDGSVDSAFNSTSSQFGTEAIVLQPDGKIIVGDDFSNLARLNTDGSVDPTFVLDDTVDYDLWSLALQPDGKILVGRSYSRQILRLNTDGSVDLTFVLGDGVGEGAQAIVVLPNERFCFQLSEL